MFNPIHDWLIQAVAIFTLGCLAFGIWLIGIYGILIVLKGLCGFISEWVKEVKR